MIQVEIGSFCFPLCVLNSQGTDSALGGPFFDHGADQLAQVESGGLHFELKVGALQAVGVGPASTKNVGQAVDVAFDIHAFFEALLSGIGLVEKVGGLNLITIKADEDIASGIDFAIGSPAFIPEGTVTAEISRKTKIDPAFALSQITARSGLVVGTGQAEAIIREGEISGVELRTLVTTGDESNNLGLSGGQLGHFSPGFAVAKLHITSDKVRKKVVVVVLAL